MRLRRTGVFGMVLTVGLAMGTLPGHARAADQSADAALLGVVFEELERRLIEEFFQEEEIHWRDPPDEWHGGQRGRQHEGRGRGRGGPPGQAGGLPPGLQRQLEERGSLPPGLQRQLDERGRLPPGLQKRALPAELERQLPRRERTERLVVGRDVVLVDAVTGAVLDVLVGVLD